MERAGGVFLVLCSIGCGGLVGDDSTEVACFTVGTEIATPDGPVAIERLNRGDRVYAYDVGAEAVVHTVVTDVHAHPDRAFRRLLVPGGRALGITQDHPVYLADHGSFVPAGELQSGQEVVRIRGGGPADWSRDPLPVQLPLLGGRSTVYDLSVASHHNFFASGVLVHNKSPDAGALCPGQPIAAGDPCSVDPSLVCPSGAQECGLLSACRCTSGRFECEPVDLGSDCDRLEGVRCFTEGTGRCDLPPPGGLAECVGGRWQFSSACPDGCPDREPPSDTVACSLEPTAVCRYASDGLRACTCDGGLLHCCDGEPPC
jgi:hypothetical protein